MSPCKDFSQLKAIKYSFVTWTGVGGRRRRRARRRRARARRRRARACDLQPPSSRRFLVKYSLARRHTQKPPPSPPVRDGRLPPGPVGQEQLPDPILVLRRPVALFRLPGVELPHERERLGRGRPLAVPDAGLAVELAAVEAVELVALFFSGGGVRFVGFAGLGFGERFRV